MANTILIVEDDYNIKEVICEYFKESGYIVLETNNGSEAIKIIDSSIEKIDLIILDIMLPDISGIDILKHIRKKRNIPVIMLTALDDEHTQILSFDIQADDYITKPFSPKLLIKRAEAVLRRFENNSTKVHYRNILFDFDSYEVKMNEESIFLTLKELEIIKVLLNHQGKVLNRQQLLNYVWGYSYFGDERIVDVHIKNIRKKLGADIISTIKGVGYKIECK